MTAGRSRSMNILPAHDDRWIALADHAGMNKNQFMRFVLEHMTTTDVDRLLKRLR